jgi:phosphate starvation-inducible protein PhoH
MGFLPGGAREKSQPYEAPYSEICCELYGRGDAYTILKQKGILEFTTTSFIRGITMTECIVIVEEIQNMTLHELDSVMTRVGPNCKIIFSGDFAQSDFVRDTDRAGLQKFLSVITTMGAHFSNIEFGVDDIVRSSLVKDYIVTKQKLGILT